MNFLDEIMSKDKYPSILSRQMEAIYLSQPSNTFRNMHGLENWRICISYNPPINFRVILLATLRHVV